MQKSCKQCLVAFEVTPDDLSFLEKVSPVFAGKKYLILPPTHCPQCRRQRKLAWRNERTLYQRTCDLCKKNIVSVHAPDSPYPVFCNPCWWSEKWDPLSFGRSYDPTRSFFEQYADLYAVVPQRAMVNDDGVMSENCAYTFDVAYAKNCYLCFGMWKCQDCYYCRICDQSKFCVDCEGVKLGSELVHDSVDSQCVHRCRNLQNSENCTDCTFGFDLKGCSDCVACVAFRQKKYCIFNEELGQDEYKRRCTELSLSSRSGIATLQKQFEKFAQNFPRKNMNLQNCEDCTGDHLFHCRDVQESYVCTNCEHAKWLERSDGPKNCYDLVQAGAPQWCYECITVDDAHQNAFCLYCNQSHNVLYSDNCISCDELLGCISLRRKKHCILNREYSKEEYEALAGSIIESMIEQEEFGEFFPVALSPYGYNETNAQEFFPQTETDVLSKEWHWRRELPYTTGKETFDPTALPDDIRDVPDSIIQEILACSVCQRNYRVIPQELEFSRTLQIPVPAKCADCRNLERLARRNPQRLWKRKCARCGKEIQTSYSPDRPEVVYCEECYLKEVY